MTMNDVIDKICDNIHYHKQVCDTVVFPRICRDRMYLLRKAENFELPGHIARIELEPIVLSTDDVRNRSGTLSMFDEMVSIRRKWRWFDVIGKIKTKMVHSTKGYFRYQRKEKIQTQQSGRYNPKETT